MRRQYARYDDSRCNIPLANAHFREIMGDLVEAKGCCGAVFSVCTPVDPFFARIPVCRVVFMVALVDNRLDRISPWFSLGADF